jgi:hypothetical protein
MNKVVITIGEYEWNTYELANTPISIGEIDYEKTDETIIVTITDMDVANTYIAWLQCTISYSFVCFDRIENGVLYLYIDIC